MDYRLSEIADITGSVMAGADNTAVSVVTDSRNLSGADGQMFVAIPGLNHDGHDFIGEMYDRGVRSFMVCRNIDAQKYPGAGFIIAQDSLEALQSLAAYHRGSFTGKVVAITGSNGKTVTKEWIAQLCPSDMKIFRSPRSYNSQLGVPLSILMLAGDEKLAVIEAGISKPGEMEKLERIIRPDIGIITNIGTAHQEGFVSQEEKLEEKLKLFRRAKTIIYTPGQEEIGKILIRSYHDRELIPTDCCRKIYAKEIPFTDQASIDNAMEAFTLYKALGFDVRSIAPRLRSLQPVAMRLEIKEGAGGSKIVNDSYNSDINSLSVALDTLSSVSGGQEKVVILSDILQSGMKPGELYGKVEEMLEAGGVSLLIGIGKEIGEDKGIFKRKTIFFDTTDELLGKLDKELFAGKAVLIKGGRAFRFERISRLLEKQIHTTILEVDMDAMAHNLNYFRTKLAPGTKTMAMVKAFSYGSGAYEIAAMLQHQRVDYLAVAFADEGVVLREAGITMPIVVLNADSWSFGTMIENRLEPEIYSMGSLRMFIDELYRHGENNYPIHIKIDTGMHRLGFEEKDIEELVNSVKNNNTVRIKSIFTHFAVSDDPAQDDFTRKQISLFNRLSRKISESLPGTGILRHASNSAGIERFSEAQFDMVRLGIGLYGISICDGDALRNVSTLKSKIVQIKHLDKGETVGYGRHGVIKGPTMIATVPIGYADGLDRRLSNGRWHFMAGGKSAPVIGNICMDTCMIDVTGIDVSEGDEVVIFGKSPTASEMAEALGTIPYEIFTSISPRVKRVFVKE